MNEKNIFGMLNADGSIASWPEVDLNGREVNRANATRAQVNSTKFVVMPMNVEFTEELKTALGGGWNGLQEWRNRTVLVPVVGFTQVDDDGNPIAPSHEQGVVRITDNAGFTTSSVTTFDDPPAPPMESFASKRQKGVDNDNS